MFDFSRIWLIAKRELTTRLKQRSYQITTVIQIVVILIAALSPVIVARFTGDDTESTASSVLVVDETEAGIAERITPYLQGDGETFETIEVDASVTDTADARQQVDDGDAVGALVATRGEDDALSFTLITEQSESSAVVQRIYGAATSLATEDRMVQAGVSPEEAQELFAPVPFIVEDISGGESEAGFGVTDANAAEYAIAYVATILMFVAVMLYGTWIAQGVVEEKSSRIMEIMVNAATPRDLLAGKVIGIMMAGLAQLLPMLLIGGLVFANQRSIADLVGVNLENVLDIDFGALSFQAVGFFLLYFLLGFILYGSVYAGIGSLVSRQEEVNQAIAPMMTFMMIGYFGAFFVLGAPNAAFAKWLMIIPLTSPFTALPRILLGDPSSGEIALSIVLLVLAMAIGVWLSGKLYRVGILMYGQRPSWKTLLRMGRMQQVSR